MSSVIGPGRWGSSPRSQRSGAVGEVVLVGRLKGEPLPFVPLVCHTGGQIVLRGRDALVLYFFPGSVCSPEDGYGSPTLDVVQQQAFTDLHEHFTALGCRVAGISSQGVELQRDAAVTHLLLSDPQLALARELGLPTFTGDGAAWYRRSMLIVLNGRIEHVVYPLNATESAKQALRWLWAYHER
jgi:peroxiredoxin